MILAWCIVLTVAWVALALWTWRAVRGVRAETRRSVGSINACASSMWWSVSNKLDSLQRRINDDAELAERIRAELNDRRSK
jgi:hypothetical protein